MSQHPDKLLPCLHFGLFQCGMDIFQADEPKCFSLQLDLRGRYCQFSRYGPALQAGYSLLILERSTDFLGQDVAVAHQFLRGFVHPLHAAILAADQHRRINPVQQTFVILMLCFFLIQMRADCFQGGRKILCQHLHVPVAEGRAGQLREIVVFHAIHNALHGLHLPGLHPVKTDSDSGNDSGRSRGAEPQAVHCRIYA